MSYFRNDDVEVFELTNEDQPVLIPKNCRSWDELNEWQKFAARATFIVTTLLVIISFFVKTG